MGTSGPSWQDHGRHPPGRRPPARRATGRRRAPGVTGGVAIELFLDRGNPLHWIAVAVLLVSGVLTAWLGVRDGFVRRTVSTSSGVLTGPRAIAAGVVYVAFGAAGAAGAIVFLLKAG